VALVVITGPEGQARSVRFVVGAGAGREDAAGPAALGPVSVGEAEAALAMANIG
jgi:hypothetical protein